MSAVDVRAPRRVLIADDDPSLLSWACRAFVRHGWTVLTASDGNAALARWQAACAADEVPSLLVTDLAMPAMDGATLVRRLRVVSPRLPVVVMSGLDIDERDWSNSDDHTIRFLRKPVSGTMLVAAAADLLAELCAPTSGAHDA